MTTDPELVHAIITTGALAGGNVMMAGGPTTNVHPVPHHVGLVEAVFFSNLALMALFVFVIPGT